MDDDNHKNIIDDSTKSKLEMFYQNTQDTLESGFDKAFTDLNTALVTTINSAFSTFETEYEKRLDANRKAHEEAMSGLNSQFATTTNFFRGNKDKKKAQSISVVDNFGRIQGMKKKAMVFNAIKKFYLKQKAKKFKRDNLLDYFYRKRKYLIFNSWRNITNSFAKIKLRTINNQQFSEQRLKMNQAHNDEMMRLKAILESLQSDIQKEINERKNLARLYDLSLKKGVEAFLRETNYVIDFDSSKIQTPNERSFVEERKYVDVQISDMPENEKAKTK